MSFKKVCKVCGREFHSAKYSSRYCSQNCYVKSRNWAKQTRHALDITRFHTRRTLDQMVENDLRERYGNLVFSTRIRENATIVQAPIVSLDIVSYAPKSNGAVDYGALCNELTGRLNDVGE